MFPGVGTESTRTAIFLPIVLQCTHLAPVGDKQTTTERGAAAGCSDTTTAWRVRQLMTVAGQCQVRLHSLSPLFCPLCSHLKLTCASVLFPVRPPFVLNFVQIRRFSTARLVCSVVMHGRRHAGAQCRSRCDQALRGVFA